MAVPHIVCDFCGFLRLRKSVSPFPSGRDTFPGPVPLRPFAPKLPASAWAVIAFLLLLVSLSHDSIDMMESQTWAYAKQSTFSAFCQELRSDPTQVAQMPLGMFSFWAWARGFGTGELAMRSLNLVWAAIALAAFARVGRMLAIPWLPALFAIQPFVWYYTNYAQTPLMQMAGGALLLAGATGFLPGGKKAATDAALLCLGGLLLSGAHFLGMLPLAAVACWIVLQGIWQKLRFSSGAKAILFLSLSILFVLSAYYVTTLLRGAPWEKYWVVSPANVLFAIYEFLGFSGFGPGRQDLRAIMKGLTSSFGLLPFIPGLLLLAGAYIFVFAAAAKSWMTRESSRAAHAQGARPICVARSYALLSPWLMGLAVPLLSMGALFLIALALGQPFWGRELAGTFPFWILALGITVHWARQGIWRKAGRFAAAAILFLLLTSSLLTRFAPWHRHDDYRGAVAEALKLSAAGKSIWWVADYPCGTYYGLPTQDAESADSQGRIYPARNRDYPDAPDAIILSRCDIFDANGLVARLLQSGTYQKSTSLKAFEIWVKAPAQ